MDKASFAWSYEYPIELQTSTNEQVVNIYMGIVGLLLPLSSLCMASCVPERNRISVFFKEIKLQVRSGNNRFSTKQLPGTMVTFDRPSTCHFPWEMFFY